MAAMTLTGQVWRYNESNVNLGTAWQGVNYNDSGWKTGRGIFAYETSASNGIPELTTFYTLTNTILDFVPITRYFRTSFDFDSNPAGLVFVFTNYIDDGMVLYVNGVEAFRYNMPGGPIAFTATANTANPSGEGIPVVVNIPGSFFVRGKNVLAAEVHQVAAGSSDVVFGMAVTTTNGPIPSAFTSLGISYGEVRLAGAYTNYFTALSDTWQMQNVAFVASSNNVLLEAGPCADSRDRAQVLPARGTDDAICGPTIARHLEP
jgi:hypothetical protein